MEDAHESSGHDIVVVGASAGGVEALKSMVGHLPADLAASVFVVLHVPPVGTSVLPRILERAGALRAVHAVHDDAIEPSVIYIAPPDQHMRFVDGHVQLDKGPKENGHRPAIDPLFRSAAELYGSRVTGVILSGVLDDGAAGLFAVARSGGAALVQSASDALYPTMPGAAMELVDSAFVGSAEELAARIVSLAGESPTMPPPFAMRPSQAPAAEHYLEVERGSSENPQDGSASGFTCPECHGGLWEVREAGQQRFRCRTGHVFTQESLLLEQSAYVERALWAALRALEEKAAMLRRMSARASDRGSRGSAARFARRAEGVVNEAVVLRGLLDSLEAAPGGVIDDDAETVA
jgi:two-component system chemotaxis response regulator CheB